jgi:hypothetical protein
MSAWGLVARASSVDPWCATVSGAHHVEDARNHSGGLSE